MKQPDTAFSLADDDQHADVLLMSAIAEHLKPADVVVRGKADGFLQEIVSGGFSFRADEPVSVGGTDVAPTPYDYVLAGLGACTSMTISLYARRKEWPLEDVTVALWHSRIHAKDCEECDTKVGLLDRVEVEVGLSGTLTAEQRGKLMEVASKCPVHRTLMSEINVKVRPAAGGGSGTRS